MTCRSQVEGRVSGGHRIRSNGETHGVCKPGLDVMERRVKEISLEEGGGAIHKLLGTVYKSGPSNLGLIRPRRRRIYIVI